MHRFKTLPLLACAATFAAACSEEDTLTPDTVGARSSAIVTHVSQSLTGALDAAGSLATAEALFGTFDDIGLALGLAPSEEIAGDGAVVSSATQYLFAPDESEPEDDADAETLARFLEEEIFIDENLESSAGNTAIFLIPGHALCDGDAECEEQVNAIEVRISVTTVGADGLDLALLISPQRYAALFLELRPQSVAAELDLAQAKAAAEHVLSVVDEDAELPEEASGRLRAAIAVLGEQAVDVKLSILEEVHLVIAADEARIALSAAAADPLFELAVDGLAGTIAVDLDVAGLDAQLPYRLLSEDESDTGTLAVHLDGASLAFDLDDASESIAVTNIGLGNARSSVTLDGAELLGVDLNAESGRRFSLSAEPAEDGASAVLTVAPELDLSVHLGLAPIADDIQECDDLTGECEEVPAFLLDDTLRLRLSGEGSAAITSAIDPASGDELLKVVAGELSLSSVHGDAPVVVGAGQCLQGLDGEHARGDESHELLRHLQARACE